MAIAAIVVSFVVTFLGGPTLIDRMSQHQQPAAQAGVVAQPAQSPAEAAAASAVVVAARVES
ncbi:hypothetical protein C7405_11653 [Paraburkholderia caballeronis]|uniref:hypothetical protein n=1 Tax=Paraburkholderia caballeronis TaxID=416943 RepID=UPI0010671465|nr:hypothetical protein [Paraburkholderia caballeronis]TDV27774.1 hypothetical protein C7405_11653 [Paraburkholderia caballeronis]